MSKLVKHDLQVDPGSAAGQNFWRESLDSTENTKNEAKKRSDLLITDTS